jgi:hypothetical protein
MRRALERLKLTEKRKIEGRGSRQMSLASA